MVSAFEHSEVQFGGRSALVKVISKEKRMGMGKWYAVIIRMSI